MSKLTAELSVVASASLDLAKHVELELDLTRFGGRVAERWTPPSTS
ncbi:MAG: hypothetical protein DDT26_02693 [Dehalococcoidia bacterium]|nr:hypothetical protein [Chloroflexota bacterium]